MSGIRPIDESTPPREPESWGVVPAGVIANLHEGLQVVDFDFRYVYVNQAVVRQARVHRNDLIGNRMADVYPGIEETKMFSILKQCMLQREYARLENEFVFPDGAVGWFELRFAPVPEGVAILSVEITDRKLMEEQLRRTLQAMATLSQCNQTLVRATDEASFLREVCAIVVDAAGYDLSWVGLLEPGDGDTLSVRAHAGPDPGLRMHFDGALEVERAGRAAVRDALRSGRNRVLRRAAGDEHASFWPTVADETVFGSCLVLPIREADTPIGVLAIYSTDPLAFQNDERAVLEEVALDLGYGVATIRADTARRHAEEELFATQIRLRTLFDHLPHPALVWRRTGRRFFLSDFNEAARERTRGALADLLGRSADGLGVEVPHFREDLDRCFRDQIEIRREVECEFPWAQGKRRLVLTYGRVPPDTVLLHAEDVTARRRTEDQLTASQRLEAVGRLAGGVAHDFNNLLSVILTYAEFAGERVAQSDPLRQELAQISAAGERAASLTRQLLAFSRRQVVEPVALDLNEVVRGLEPMLRRLLGEDVEVAVRTEEPLSCVLADRSQAEQVIMNLAVNARDAMPDGGRLTIETALVELDEEYASDHVGVEPGEYVLLGVTDSGTGMDAETQSRIFEPFFTTKEPGKGTGLGLSTVYGIVKQAGGNIWVYSEPGCGTTFKIYLPRIGLPATGARLQVPGGLTRPLGTERILVVEDQPAVRAAVVRILLESGYEVLSAGSGREALDLISGAEAEPDLLLTDVVMPEMSGAELASRMREILPGLRVLFTSGYTDASVVRNGVLEEGMRFLAKPFSSRTLAQRVREVLDESPGGS